MRNSLIIVICLICLTVLCEGCSSRERDRREAFQTSLNLSPQWRLYEQNDQKIIYINSADKKLMSERNFEFQMIRKIKRYEDHKAFVEILKKAPNVSEDVFDRFSFLKTDEAVNCSNGKWITSWYYIMDSNGNELASFNGLDIDDTVYEITPKLNDMVCRMP